MRGYIFLLAALACASSRDRGDVPMGDAPMEVVLTEGVEDAPHQQAISRARLVNPLIGTGGAVFNLGNTYPGAAVPFGLVKVSPDTVSRFGGTPPSFQHCAGYRYEDEHMYGFSHNHLHGTGVPDYGNVLLRPLVGMEDTKTHRDGYRTPYTHEGEEARPGYYAVTLQDPMVRAEVTATKRCAHHRYTFLDRPPQGVVIVDAASALVSGRSKGGEVRIEPAARTVEGRNWNYGEFSSRFNGFDVYFVVRFNRSPASVGTWLDGKTGEGRLTVSSDKDGANFGAYAAFDTAQDPTVEAQVCLSYVDLDGARAAMAQEMPAFDFEGVRARAEAMWEKELGVFEVEGGTDEDQVNFYTAIYHALQMPTTWSDVDGRYLGFDRKVHKAEGFVYYTDLSLWDTFRTEHPLLALAWPEVQRDVLRSLVAMKEQGGYVPKWAMGCGDTGSMIGEHAATVAADSYVKNIRDFDVEALWAGLAETADGPLPQGAYGERDCIESYLELGYVPAEECGDAVSMTLEYAFNDFCMARLAEAIGRLEDAARYDKRAGNWKNVYNPETGFMQPRRRDGGFVAVNPEEWSPKGYTEGTAWQWLWFVPHDEAGLRAAMGGDQAFIARLQEFFDKSEANFSFEVPNAWYFHGNEPDIHAASLFIRAGRPELAQRYFRWALARHYRNAPDGLVGNDDAGTLAAWYVFVAIGLYPVPCVPGYLVISPIFERATVHLPGGDLKIEAPMASRGRPYIRRAFWNGQPLDELWLSHDTVAKGGALFLEMSEEPASYGRQSLARVH